MEHFVRQDSMESALTARPRLTRTELIEVIRANVEAFKEDPSFYDYLTELVIYLMEYEYDWQDANKIRASETQTKRRDGTEANSPAHPHAKYRFEFIQPVNLGRGAVSTGKRTCRVCGADLANRLVCPNCLSGNRQA
jgi:hypothetical protein